MDKAKQRTDLLAAGRKKLQQYRNKKDHKGAKSSNKSTKPDTDGCEGGQQAKVPGDNSAIEMETGDPLDSSVEAQPVDSPTEEARGGVVEAEMDLGDPPTGLGDSRSAVALSSGAMQEANRSGTERHSIDDLIPSSGLEVASEADHSFARTEGREMGFSFDENGGDEKHVASENSRAGIGGVNEEFEGDGLPAPDGSIQAAVEGHSNEPEGITSQKEHFEMPSSAERYMQQAFVGEDVTVDRESLVEILKGRPISLMEKDERMIIQEVKHSGSEQFDIDGSGVGMSMTDHGREDSDWGTVDVASNVDVIVDDGVVIPSSGLKVGFEVDKSSAQKKEHRGGEMGFSLEENGGNESSAASENNGVHTGGVDEETDAAGDRMSVPVEAIQEKVVNLSDGSEGSASQKECFEMSSSARDTSTFKREDGALIVGGEWGWRINEEGPMSLKEKDGFADGLECLRMHLYLANVAKDFAQLQLAEQIELNAELHRNSTDVMSKFQGLVRETQESKVMINEELAQCRSELQASAIQKGELENRCLSTDEEIEELRTRAWELQGKLELSLGELSRVSGELADCRGSLEALQMENLKYAASLISETDARKKLVEEKEFLSNANMDLASELLAQKEGLIIALDKQTQLDDDLRETWALFEELTEENLSLSSSLVVHEGKIKELDGGYYELPFQARETYVDDSHTSYDNCEAYVAPVTSENSVVLFHAQGPSLQKDDEVDSGSSAGILKGNLERAKSLVESLEKSIQEMHSHSVSLIKSGGRAAAPGISKLIQAFEPKAHLVDNVPDAAPLTEGGRSEDSYTLASQQACDLKDLLIKMDLDVGKIELFLKGEENNRRLSEQIKMDWETQRQQDNILQAKINDLDEKLSDYESRIGDLQNYVNNLKQSANDEAGVFFSRVELLQKEVNDRASTLGEERDSIRGVIFETMEKLNASTGLLISDDVDIGSLVSSSVDAATTAIRTLNEQLEAAHHNYHTLSTSFEELNKLCSDIKGKKELAIERLNKYYISLSELANDSCQNAGEAEIVVNSEEALQFIPDNCEELIGRLQGLLDERLRLLSTNNKLESELLNRNQDVEQLNVTCNSLVSKLEVVCHAKDGLESVLIDKNKDIEEFNRICLSLAKKLEEHDLCQDLDTIHGLAEDNLVVVKIGDSDFCKSLLVRLEALVACHIQMYEEAIEQINLSKNYLQEVSPLSEISAFSWSSPLPTLLQQEFVPKVTELQEKMHFLSLSNLQMENEVKNLKEGGSKMEEALEASRSELHLKASELEQSEQRVSSVREKLSIAVTKGKGLIVQRDSLKQSLMEKSGELEKCTQEMLSKESLLHELEAKLKSCSEVERVEALESELSYIRNSATALRDSFLLKDSVLQRIEEVLEDIDLPEHFHSKDIVEKIELLARSVLGNSSFTVTDWDQRSSDSGFVVMDARKDDLLPSSNPEFDELKRKYEELQSKLYGLAEHNDMLEQSMLERNNRVQKWEDILNGIDVPPQLRTLEPEDRIGWLRRTLSEVQQERDALQLKIENLEDSSDMLIVDLEESHKKISELSAEVVAVKSEKEFFSESLHNLRYEYLGLSEKAVQDELDRENLQRKLDHLQGKLVKDFQNKDHCDIEKEMQRLHDLIVNALPDSERFDSLPGGSDTECLEELLMKLINNYTSLCTDKSMHRDSEKELISEESNLCLVKTVSKDVSDEKEQALISPKLELDEAFRNLVLVEDERDAAMKKCSSLMLEIETISNQRNLLQEERTKEEEKYQFLVLELEAMIRQREALQEQLTQEEQRSSSAREKLNTAVRKGKVLVQQRDSLKQTIEEMNTVVERLKIEHSQRVEALESENSSLINQLDDTSLTLSRLLTALHGVDVHSEVNIVDPVQKMEGIRKLCHDLHSAVVFSENEAKKSKRAAELLLAELNEVQERADILQEELSKAEAAKTDVHSRLEQVMSVHSEERKKQVDNLVQLKRGTDHLREGCYDLSSLISNVFTKDVDNIGYLEAFMESILKQMNGANVAELPVLSSSSLLPSNSTNEGRYLPFGADSVNKVHEHFMDGSITEHLALASNSLHECVREYDAVKENIHKRSYFIDQQATSLLKVMETVQRKLASRKEFSESLKRDVAGLELMVKEKETELFSMRRNVSLLYEACSNSVLEIENRKARIVDNSLTPGEHVIGKSDTVVKFPSYIDEYANTGQIFPITDDYVRMIADTLLSTVKHLSNINDAAEANQRKLKAAAEDLQRELQEKDIQTNRICTELVSQIREAEDVAKRSMMDLNSARAQVLSLEKQVEIMENDKKSLELRVNELKEWETSSKMLQERNKSLTDALCSKDQEIEALMQALDEEESQMEGLENRNKELVNIVQEKNVALENLEASRSKAVGKVSTTMNKFDELHNLSESLLAEIENLQSQLQDQDSEISFLRQEVTRCTNDFLASQETNNKYSSEIHELQTWMNLMLSLYGIPHVSLSDQEGSKIRACTDIIEKKSVSIMAELNELRMKAESKDALRQIERGKLEELLCKVEVLETSLLEKETQIELFQGKTDSVQSASMNTPGPLEIEQIRNKVSLGPIKTHVRGGRKVNNDQIAIAIDTEKDGNLLEDEDDDKAHGFKSLTMSRIVPRAIRPIADRIDGIWVSGERLLMRQPTLRLGLLLYWVALHVLLASVI